MPDASRQTISATQMSALFGASKYDTPFTIYHHLIGNNVEKVEDNRMSAGTRFEAPVIAWAAEDLGVAKVVPNRDDTGRQRYITRGLLGCHRDADMFDGDKGWGALETKMIFDYRVLMQEWEGGETPPKMHEIQLQQQMYIGTPETGPFKWGVLTACCGGELMHFHREPMPELWEAFDKAAADMFENIKLGAEPDPMGLSVEHPLLNKLYPPNPKKVLDLSAIVDPDASPTPEELAETVRRLEYLDAARAMVFHSEQKSFHGKAYDDAKDRLRCLAMDNHKVLLPYGGAVEIKQSQRKEYTVKASTTTTVKPFVPAALPDNFMEKFANVETAI